MNLKAYQTGGKGNTHDSHNGQPQHQEKETSIHRVSQPLQFLREPKKLSVGDATIELINGKTDELVFERGHRQKEPTLMLRDAGTVL